MSDHSDRSLSGFIDGLSFDRFVTLLFFTLVATIACLMPIQNDTWWQLRAGQDFWESGRVPLVETYSHTAAGGFWMNHEWLSEAIFYALYQTGGLPLLIAWAAFLATATMAVAWSLMQGSTLIRLALCGVSLSAISIAWTPRPHIFTLFLVGVCAKLIISDRDRWLPLVFLLWANLHGGFTLGVGLLGAYGLTGLTLGFRPTLRRSVIVGLCLIMTLLTPLGFTFWEELPASLARLQAYDVQEWQGPTLTNFAVLPFWLALAALGVLLVRRRQALFADPTDRFLIVASVLFVPLALTSLRNVPPFLLVTLAALSRALPTTAVEDPPALPRTQTRIHAALLGSAAGVAIVLIAAAWLAPLPRLQWRPVSSEAVAAVEACEGPLYNSYDDGGYLIWFVPQRKVFLDSRQDPYPVRLIQQDIRAQFEGDYQEMFSEHRIQCAFVRSGVPLDRQLQADGWNVRYRDPTWTVLRIRPGGRLAEPATTRSRR